MGALGPAATYLPLEAHTEPTQRCTDDASAESLARATPRRTESVLHVLLEEVHDPTVRLDAVLQLAEAVALVVEDQ